MSKEEKPLEELTIKELRDKMTPKQSLFVDAYLANGFNATQAAEDAKYKGNRDTLRQVGAENIAKPYLAAYIQKKMKGLAMGADEALARVADIARGDMGKFIKIGPDKVPEISLKQAKDLGITHLIKRTRVKKTTRRMEETGQEITDYETMVELYSSQDAIRDILRVHGLFKDNVNMNIDGMVGVLNVGEAPDVEQWANQMKAYREAANTANQVND